MSSGIYIRALRKVLSLRPLCFQYFPSPSSATLERESKIIWRNESEGELAGVGFGVMRWVPAPVRLDVGRLDCEFELGGGQGGGGVSSPIKTG